MIAGNRRTLSPGCLCAPLEIETTLAESKSIALWASMHSPGLHRRNHPGRPHSLFWKSGPPRLCRLRGCACRHFPHSSGHPSCAATLHDGNRDWTLGRRTSLLLYPNPPHTASTCRPCYLV